MPADITPSEPPIDLMLTISIDFQNTTPTEEMLKKTIETLIRKNQTELIASLQAQALAILRRRAQEHAITA